MSVSPGAGRGRALVVFRGEADLPWLRALEPGFRHCFVAVNDGDDWIICDPDSRGLRFSACDPSWDLGTWYRAKGFRVVETDIREPAPGPYPWFPFTCVEAAKRILGLRGFLIWTPRQLFNHLTKGG